MTNKPDPAATFFGFDKPQEAAPQSPTTSDPASEFFGFDKPPAPPPPAAAAGGGGWGETIKSGANQAYQGFLEGGAGLLGLPAIAEHAIGAGFSKAGIEIPDNALTRFLTPKTAAEMLGSAQKELPGPFAYDPTQPTDLTGRIERGAGQATAALPLGAEMGMGAGANALYTYVPSLAGSVAEHFGVNPLLAALPTALTMSGIERKIGEYTARQAAARAAEKAAADAAAAKAAQEAHEAGGPAFTRGLQEQQDVAQAQAGRGKAFTEADAAKRHDSEITAADTQLQAEHTGADADREAVASQLGTSKTLEEGTGKMQDQARQWLDKEYKKKLGDAEDGLFYKNPADHSQGTLIPPDALGDATNLKNSIEHSYIMGAGVEGEPIASMFRSRLPEAVNAKLDMLAQKQGLPAGAAPQFTFADLRNIRSAIGDAIGDPTIMSSIGVKKLNEMYKGVSDDMRAAIKNSAGQEGLDAFDKFNKEASRIFGVAGNVGENIVTTTNAARDTITPKMVADNKGLWEDSTKINQLRSEPTLDKGVNEVAASKLRAGGVDAETAYDKLPEARTAMFGPQGEQALDAIKARRAAAEGAAAKTKAAADKDLADMREAAAKQSAASLKGAEASRQDLRQGRSETGISLKQETEARKIALQEAQAKLQALRNPPKGGGFEIPGWMKGAAGLGSLGGAFEAGRNLGPLAAHFPSWGADTVGAIAGAGAGGLALAARELYKNPAARRNLLQAGAATGTAPNALGWSVEENK